MQVKRQRQKQERSYLRMALTHELVDDDETLVTRDLSHVQGALKKIGVDLRSALFGPGCKNDV